MALFSSQNQNESQTQTPRNSILRMLISVLAILIVAGLAYFVLVLWKKQEPAPPLSPTKKEFIPQEVLKSLTAPTSNMSAEVPKEVLKSLTAPPKTKKSEIPQSVIQALTAP